MMRTEQYGDFWDFMRLLAEHDLLRYVILVGSWAEYVYEQAAILPGFDVQLRTLSIF